MLAFFVAATWWAAAGEQPAPPKPPDGVRSFAEGVRIDWPNLTIELDAEVAMREGPLELFACSPRSKEHESILIVSARPTHIYQALGLIGLNPGSPTRFDERNHRREAARGDRLDVRVRYPAGSGTQVVASEKWVASAKGATLEPPPPLRWVFAGSLTANDGRLAADIEGTVACLVDFESALIALNTSHSADNEQLWLVADTNEIPPRGTKCTLLIRSDHRPAVEVELLNEHTARYRDESLLAEQLAKVLRPPPDDDRPARLIIRPAPDVSDAAAAAYVQKITKSGFQGTIETKRRPPEKPIPPPG